MGKSFSGALVLILFLSTITAIFYINCNDRPTLTADIYKLTRYGTADELGTIEFIKTGSGIYVSVLLEGLPPGVHGFHIHEGASCGPVGSDGRVERGLSAGGHYAMKTDNHAGPVNYRHAGDLPRLLANKGGIVKTSFIIKGMNIDEIAGRTIIIHVDGDNYNDAPALLGGDRGRFACGVLQLY